MSEIKTTTWLGVAILLLQIAIKIGKDMKA